MSHFGRAGPPDIRDSYSLLVLNITFRTTADDLYPLFDKYGEVVDVFIPRNRRTGDSRGFAFVRYKYADEAQKAVEKLDGRMVDGREIMVQFAKYGPNAERIHRDEYRDRDYRRRSRSRSRDRYDRDRHRRSEREHRRRSRSRSASPYHDKGQRRGRYGEEKRSRSRSGGRSASPAQRSPDSQRSSSPRRSRSRDGSPNGRNGNAHSPPPKDTLPRAQPVDSRSPSPQRSDADE